MRQTGMHALRQLLGLMLCGEAAEHQLALISDTAEITDTYPTPPDEVQSANPTDYIKACIIKFCYLKMQESTAQKQV